MINSDHSYKRTEIDKIFTKTKALMQQAALIRGGDGTVRYIDVYTRRSAEVVHRSCNDYN
jgi:hypothetical protein